MIGGIEEGCLAVVALHAQPENVASLIILKGLIGCGDVAVAQRAHHHGLTPVDYGAAESYRAAGVGVERHPREIVGRGGSVVNLTGRHKRPLGRIEEYGRG